MGAVHDGVELLVLLAAGGGDRRVGGGALSSRPVVAAAGGLPAYLLAAATALAGLADAAECMARRRHLINTYHLSGDLR